MKNGAGRTGARKRQFSFEANTHAASTRWEGADLRQITPETAGKRQQQRDDQPAGASGHIHATAQRGRLEGVPSTRACNPGGIAATTATTGRRGVLSRLPNKSFHATKPSDGQA